MAQLFPRVAGWAPRNRFGALVAREARYWWRDARRRANLITIAVVGVFVPVMVNLGGAGFAVDGEQGLTAAAADTSPVMVTLSMLFVGVLAAVTLANQFGFDGSAYAANVVAGGARPGGAAGPDGRVLGVRVPMLAVVAVVLSRGARTARLDRR